MKDSRGFTLIEILIVVLMIGVMAALVVPNIRFGIDPLRDTTNRLAANLKLMRAKAMGQTSAYRIRPISATQLIVERARQCSDANSTWEREPSFTDEDLNLNEVSDVKGMAQHETIQIEQVIDPANSSTPLTAWILCYNSRGLSDKGRTREANPSDEKDFYGNLVFTLKSTSTNQTRRIEVFSGGGIQIYDN